MSEKPWIAPERPDLVWYGGSDALRFLNDIISQELEDMMPGDARRSFLLEPQGKLEFLMWVLRDGDRFGLVTDPGRGGDLESTLSRYMIRVEVDAEAESRDVWIVVGPCEGYDISWPGVERHLVIGEKPGLEEGADEDYERLRIAAGEPKWGVDVDERTIPHASGLVPASVDFGKGCFLGQELVARIDSRGGNTPKNLFLVQADGDIAAGEPVVHDGNQVGTVTSAAAGVGLAMLKRGVSEGDTVQVGPRTAIVNALPAKSQ